MSTQDRAAPGVYDPLETVSYFKYCITPHPHESQENAVGYISINSMYHVPQNVVQIKLCTTCTKNVVQNVVHIVVQTRVHGGNSIQV